MGGRSETFSRLGGIAAALARGTALVIICMIVEVNWDLLDC